MSVLYKVNDDFLQVAGSYTGGNVPVGVILPYMGIIAPIDDWLMCDGSAYDTNKYAGLFQILGTDHVPDMRNKTTFGAADTANIGDETNGALPNIKGAAGRWRENTQYTTAGALYRYSTTRAAGGSGGSSETVSSIAIDASRSSPVYKDNQTFVEPASLKVNYIIKAR